jgi:hypothetical protein
MCGRLHEISLKSYTCKFSSRAARKMFICYCLLLAAVGYQDGLEASAIRHLPNVSTQNRSTEPQESDLVGKGEHRPSRGSYVTHVQRPLNYVVHQVSAPLVENEEGEYFEGDIILRPEQQLSSVSISSSTCLCEGWGVRNAYEILVIIPQRKRLLWRPKRRFKDNTKTILRAGIAQWYSAGLRTG